MTSPLPASIDATVAMLQGADYLPDRALAKQARKAALRHRSWLANGGTSSR